MNEGAARNAENAFSASPSIPSNTASYGMASRFRQTAALPARSSRLRGSARLMPSRSFKGRGEELSLACASRM